MREECPKVVRSQAQYSGCEYAPNERNRQEDGTGCKTADRGSNGDEVESDQPGNPSSRVDPTPTTVEPGLCCRDAKDCYAKTERPNGSRQSDGWASRRER